MNQDISNREIISSRTFSAPRGLVYKAFADPNQLAQWWGPKGFTNTFNQFDLRPGGLWRCTMHAPNGAQFHNESKFTEVTEPERIVFQHLEPIHTFTMAMTFTEQDGTTTLTWRMVFDSADECAKVKNFIIPANEENFDRLAAHLQSRTDESHEDTSKREIIIS